MEGKTVKTDLIWFGLRSLLMIALGVGVGLYVLPRIPWLRDALDEWADSWASVYTLDVLLALGIAIAVLTYTWFIRPNIIEEMQRVGPVHRQQRLERKQRESGDQTIPGPSVSPDYGVVELEIPSISPD